VTAVVNAPPSKVYEIMTNCDKFPDRLPHVLDAETVARGKHGNRCKVTIDLPFPLSNLTAVTQDRRKRGPHEWYRKWKLVKGDYSVNDGSVVLKEFRGDPNRTLFEYRVHAVPKTIVPDFLRERAQKRSLPNMVKRIRKEVRKI